MHEIGHVLGLGTLWLDNYLLSDGQWYYETEYWNSDYTNALYIGTNALREYKLYVTNKYKVDPDSIIGIPVEENGGGGTAGGHIEEGDFGDSIRYFDNNRHYGLDNELMTGWSESSNVKEPLSKITIGMVEDLGFSVDYSFSDDF